jgi:signal transduction histidine kinase
MDEIILSLRPRYKKNSHVIQITCEQDIELNSFPGAFSQILSNLIMNSLIHGFDGLENRAIDIGVTSKEGQVVFVYQDNGRGMDPQQREKVFDPFYTTMRGKGGTGLGMSIVFNLVTQTLKGNIHLESEVDQGVVLTMTFPQHGDDH